MDNFILLIIFSAVSFWLGYTAASMKYEREISYLKNIIRNLNKFNGKKE